jgi:hypothetical protein
MEKSAPAASDEARVRREVVRAQEKPTVLWTVGFFTAWFL